MDAMVPSYNIHLTLVLFFKQGSVGPNRYGFGPLSPPRSTGLIEGPT
jgi:hypothetical protein